MKILVDMDGTIANWGKGWDKFLDTMYFPMDTENIPRHANQTSFDLHAGLNDAEKKIVDDTMNSMSYLDLKPIPGAIDALKEMLSDGHDVRIVTSPWLTNECCISDKFKWVQKHLGAEWLERVIVTKDKTHIAADYLIDDKPEVKGSATPTWEHVLFDQPYNQDVIGKSRITSWDGDFYEWYDDAVVATSPVKFAMGEPVLISGEVRTTSSTGGQKGTKIQRYDLLPISALKQVAQHYGVGALKYDANQYRLGYEWSKSYAALQRHANQFWGGEDFDEETGSNHMAAVAWHALTLLTFFEEHPQFDDRYKTEVEK